MASLFRSVFLKSFSLEEPVIELGKVPHWLNDRAFQSTLPPEIDLCKTYVTGGCFYQFSSKVPSISEIEYDITQAQTLGAQLLIIPSIRDCEDIHVLEEKGFIRLPGSTETIVNMEEDINKMISSRTSGQNLRNLKRLKRLADADYELVYYKSKELSNSQIKDISDLHDLLIEKHNLPHNIYNEEAIKEMISNDPDNSLLFIFRYEKETKRLVQAIITIQDDPDEVHGLTLPINHDIVPPKQNLWKVGFYELLLYAHENGIKRANLGRGNTDVKTSIFGADLTISQSNWIKHIS